MYIRMTFRSFEIYELLEPLLDAERAVVCFVLAPDERVELVVRADCERAFGVAREAYEHIVCPSMNTRPDEDDE